MLPTLERVPALAYLTVLSAAGCRLTTLGHAGAERWPRLEQLDVSHNELASLAGLGTPTPLGRLRRLIVSHNRLNDAAGALRALRQGGVAVAELDLRANPITQGLYTDDPDGALQRQRAAYRIAVVRAVAQAWRQRDAAHRHDDGGLAQLDGVALSAEEQAAARRAAASVPATADSTATTTVRTTATAAPAPPAPPTLEEPSTIEPSTAHVAASTSFLGAYEYRMRWTAGSRALTSARSAPGQLTGVAWVEPMRPTAATAFPGAALDKDERWRLAGSELDTTVGTLSDASLPTGPTPTTGRTVQPSTVRATAASSERAQPNTPQASLASPPKRTTAARPAVPTHVPDRSELLVRVATAADDGLSRPDDALLVRRGLEK